jgi:tRNA dimethylallyltransferase
MNLGIEKPKILVIVGPTASGKTGLSIELAKQFNGEVVSADSRQVYRGMDIGSAKVTQTEMAGIPHHLLDVADPKETYTASDFKRDAEAAVEDILSRGKLPIVCGGTFFYVDTLLGKISLPEVEPDEELRAELEQKSASELFSILESLDPKRASTIEPGNPRRIIRAIEVATKLGYVPESKEIESPYDAFTIGLTVDMKTHADILRKRLMERLDVGMMAEVESLLANGVTHERLEKFGLEYRYASRYLRGEIDFETMINEIVVKSRQFAKRQLTWLKRDQDIKWFDKNDPNISTEVKKFLAR